MGGWRSFVIIIIVVVSANSNTLNALGIAISAAARFVEVTGWHGDRLQGLVGPLFLAVTLRGHERFRGTRHRNQPHVCLQPYGGSQPVRFVKTWPRSLWSISPPPI